MNVMWSMTWMAMAAAWVSAAPASAPLVIVVRHAERADGGAAAGNAMTASPDPGLSPVGQSRAIALATMLKDSGVTAIYTTEFRRTRETAAPVAAALNLDPVMMSARETEALVAQIRTHASGAVLVVGHSNTIPAIIKALGGADVTLDDSDYDSLFVVASGGATTRIRFRP